MGERGHGDSDGWTDPNWYVSLNTTVKAVALQRTASEGDDPDDECLSNGGSHARES